MKEKIITHVSFEVDKRNEIIHSDHHVSRLPSSCSDLYTRRYRQHMLIFHNQPVILLALFWIQFWLKVT